MGRSTVVVLALALAASRATSARPPASAPRMERTPAYVLAYCKKSQRLPLACPHLLPRMSQPSPHWEANLCLAGHQGCAGLTWDDLSLVDAGAGTRPPVWSHVVVQAGNLARALRFHATRIGTFTWGGRRGTVVLTPGFPAGGEQGGHLIFRWREGRTDLALGLHGWEPLSQALATLRLMVISI